MYYIDPCRHIVLLYHDSPSGDSVAGMARDHDSGDGSHSSGPFELRQVQVVVESVLCQQRRVRTTLDNMSPVDDQDLINSADGTEPVGNNEASTPLHQVEQRPAILNMSLAKTSGEQTIPDNHYRRAVAPLLARRGFSTIL